MKHLAGLKYSVEAVSVCPSSGKPGPSSPPTLFYAFNTVKRGGHGWREELQKTRSLAVHADAPCPAGSHPLQCLCPVCRFFPDSVVSCLIQIKLLHRTERERETTPQELKLPPPPPPPLSLCCQL